MEKKMQKLKHLLWRTGFGPRTQSWDKWIALSENAWWPKMKDDSALKPEYFDIADSAVKGLLMGIGEIGRMERRDLDQAEKKQIREQSRDDLRNLNLLWLEEMTRTQAQLREKIALFWHGHFASRNINILYQQQLLHVIRENALGNFRDLLRGVSKSAAIIAFLNNQQNKKQHPNENFAREVMELFTMGRGHYTENDIKEAARAFTGWSFKLNGDFVFRAFDHDKDEKTVLGKSGKFDGDDIIDILLEKRDTACFIARKMYKFLVNDTIVPEERITCLGDRFYDSGYQILRLLDDIVRSDWFFAPENMGCRIKSPVEYWIGIRRVLPLELEEPEVQLKLQRALDQILFYPPNVAGWPGGKAWIDSSSLMLRLRIPQLIVDRGDLDVQTKDDDDQQMGMKNKNQKGVLTANVDWKPVLKQFAGVSANDLAQRVADYLWQTETRVPVQVLEKYTAQVDKDSSIKSMMIRLMATPEYQLC
jgi:uncharacterized protein (DUF1800 family)